MLAGLAAMGDPGVYSTNLPLLDFLDLARSITQKTTSDCAGPGSLSFIELIPLGNSYHSGALRRDPRSKATHSDCTRYRPRKVHRSGPRTSGGAGTTAFSRLTWLCSGATNAGLSCCGRLLHCSLAPWRDRLPRRRIGWRS
jgi:hypothetical protein